MAAEHDEPVQYLGGSTRYSLKPFDSENQIRLLSFGASELPLLRCSLTQCNLDTAPPYYAVSYCWGDGADKTPLECNGAFIHITTELYRGLIRLHEFVRNDTVSHFWIDQICINQCDATERSHQVRMMWKIYTMSQRTVIWINLEEDAQLAKDIVEVICRLSWARATHLLYREKGVDPAASMKMWGLANGKSQQWSVLARFLDNAWFSRVWVIQEAALSIPGPAMLCEDRVMDFDVFSQAMSWLKAEAPAMKIDHIPASVSYGMYLEIGLIRFFRRHKSLSPSDWKIGDLLSLVSGFKATDPRDYIYALLGLTSQGRKECGTETVFTPDYGIDPIRLYAEIVRHLISQNRKLNILGAGGTKLDMIRGISDGMASWIPRWDCERHQAMVTDIAHSRYYDIDENGESPQVTMRDLYAWDASGGSLAQLKDTGREFELVIKAVRVASISWTSEIVCQADFIRDQPRTILALWEHCLGHLEIAVEPHNPRLHEAARSFFTAIIFEVDVDGASISPDKASLKYFWKYLLDRYESKNIDSATEERCIETYRTLASGSDPYVFKPGIPGRKLYITTGGRIGYGTAAMLVGDELFVLFGGDIPQVLRKRGAAHQLAGEAYLYGIMNGEAIKAWEDGSLSDHWITLI